MGLLIQEEKNCNRMDVIDAIYSRRSVRQYSRHPVESDRVEELLNMAIQAPSAMNKQPWAFVVIQDHQLLSRLNQQAKEFLRASPNWRLSSEHSRGLLDPTFDIFYGANTLIIIYAEKHGFEPIGDCYLAGANLMLAATGLGLGSCPIGFLRDVLRAETVYRELGLSDSYVPVLPIVIGYPAGLPQAPPRNPPRILNWIR